MQTQQYIRSTVSLPVDLHQELRMEAIKRRKTFSDIVLEKLGGKSKLGGFDIDETLNFFRKISQTKPVFDGVAMIRKNRDVDTI